MASKPSGGGANRLSFAKIAAMPPPSKPQPAAAPHDENPSRTADDLKIPPVSHSSSTTPPSQSSSSDDQRNDATVSEEFNGLERGVQSLELSEQQGREGSESSGEERVNGVLQRETSFDDDQTHLSNSSTKPTSFDSKSMASVTTFAMDEKDSLRPDDNGDIRVTGTIPPDSVSNNFVVPNSGNFQAGKPLHGFPEEPDEKLLEAMSSPKDRLLLLQLEEKIRNFIQDSKEQSLDLPPSNAFGRLLAHKLGDYYHLTHFVDNTITSVRLHRTPFTRLPTPLSQLRPANANNTPPPNAPAMKIMRRTDQNADRPATDGSTAASSSAPSKAASETGGEGGNEEGRTGSSAGATPAKERTTMTREEREAKYQEARERIFRDFPESKSENNSGDNSANMSRSSSTSGRKKNFRQKTPHDDTFEVRSQFNVYYPGMPYTTGPVPMPVAMHNGSFPGQPPYVVGPGASPPAMNYAQNNQNGAVFSSPVNSVHHYPMAMPPHMGQNSSWQAAPVPQQSPFSGYASMNQPSPMVGQQSSTRSSPAMNNSYAVPNPTQFPPASSTTWASPPYQGNFSQSPQRNAPVHWPNYPSPSMAPNTAPYPYGQLPGQHFSVPVQNSVAHPLPGNYNRPPFNPQTRSFVPGGGTSSARHSGKGPQHGANVSYPGSQASGQQPWTGYPDNHNHGQPATHMSPHAGNKNSNNAAPSNSNPPRGPSSGNQDSIAKWGTPAHLPPKPPPSEVPSDFDIKGRNSSSSSHSYQNNIPPSSKNGPLVVSGGTSVPKSS
ncbi:hypothetical protein T310_7389 [Rasamsonia emersonii CBS 393.64]|uniref:R3H domain protein n=1 Tax=Rasamsonia emersonii (strain ATCC 16479 / CBS 393.64 / IMI 116815) TaxID=1408163 RepID=A0A0F4YKB0_RASE3|nr:hypothetical protein T310_7389 [Rasamsonia emersonii CBS 393.64]KKA18644.1 hypothetical protein T310_7389 [Rasamsonia emersonii CBS 393.64]